MQLGFEREHGHVGSNAAGGLLKQGNDDPTDGARVYKRVQEKVPLSCGKTKAVNRCLTQYRVLSASLHDLA